MAISQQGLLKHRPFLFHLTAVANLDRILRTRRLDSAAGLLRLAGRSDLARLKRHNHVTVDLGGERVLLRDQAVLYAGNMALEPGWTLEAFVEHLNKRVFFWPGSEEGPIPYGVRHYERYSDEKPAILRVETADLLAHNPGRPPLFCRYNSGSPRCSSGLGSPRGANTFRPAEQADFGVGNVVEVTFLDDVRLPARVDIGARPAGPWRANRLRA